MDFIINHSKNFRVRKERIKYIIIHCSIFSPEKQIEILNEYGLSVHYIISQEGKITENLSVENVAYHAGISFWNKSKEKSLNECSIGIELEAPTLGQSPKDYTFKQIKALCELLSLLKETHQIRTEDILGHSDIAPQAKPDPGKGFPWKKIAKLGFGVWYDLRSKSATDDEKVLLSEIGYNTSDLHAARMAFCRHFFSSDAGDFIEPSVLVDTPFELNFSPKNYNKYLKILRATAKAFSVNRQK